MFPDFLKDKYEPIKLLSRSYFSSVYLALQKPLGRKVVVKILAPHLVEDGSVFKRFEREGKILASLDEEGVTKIYDFGQVAETVFIVSEFVQGRSLKEILEAKKKLEIEEGLKIIKMVALILSRVHKKGVLHRDIKPSNIILKEDGVVKLVDFGLAHTLNLEKLTIAGEIIGTPAYMSPEQISGKSIDLRSDIFSLGVVAYELLTGENPFTAETFTGVLNKVLNFKPKIGRVIADFWIVELLEKMLAKKLENRFKSCDEIVAYIDPILSDLSKTKIEKPFRLNFRVAVLIFLVLAVSILIFLFLKGSSRPPKADSFATTIPQETSAMKHTLIQRKKVSIERSEMKIRLRRTIPDTTVAHKRIKPSAFHKDKFLTAKEKPTGEIIPDSGYLKLAVTPWADVYLNEKYNCQTPIARALKLNSGPVSIRFTNQEIGSFETLINLIPKETLKLFIDLPGRFSGLKVLVDPWARIYLNGEYKGITPMSKIIYLPPGKYELRLENPNFQTFAETLVLKPSEIREKYVKFYKEHE